MTTMDTIAHKREALRDLRSKTDDALEEFVKAQIALFAKMDEVKKANVAYEGLKNRLDELLRNTDYRFLKIREKEIDMMELDLHVRKSYIDSLKSEEFGLEQVCVAKEAALTEARKAESDFLDNNM